MPVFGDAECCQQHPEQLEQIEGQVKYVELVLLYASLRDKQYLLAHTLLTQRCSRAV